MIKLLEYTNRFGNYLTNIIDMLFESKIFVEENIQKFCNICFTDTALTK